MSPGVVDYLFRQLVEGRPAEDIQWSQEGPRLSEQPPGAELARRLAECDVEALTPTELFHYVRAAQRLASWAEVLREEAVSLYCGTPSPTGRGADEPDPQPNPEPAPREARMPRRPQST
ncbi:hypothetical protein [Arthrobacter sp. 92]|jgi:hypothetical protein|uniref:hypothetical protein n=1 Tax=Arthrobacter sp. 92 TaxID=3418175 RepID=UPI003D058D57